MANPRSSRITVEYCLEHMKRSLLDAEGAQYLIDMTEQAAMAQGIYQARIGKAPGAYYWSRKELDDDIYYHRRVSQRNAHQAMVQMYGTAVIALALGEKSNG